MAWIHFCLVLTSLITALSGAEANKEFCQRGFKIAGKFHGCWEDATYSRQFPALRQPENNMYTGKMLEAYATHMCSVVKPIALDCLRDEVNECPNAAKIVETADESGGACHKDQMNPYFKLYITDLLQPIPRDSSCFLLGGEAYKCYEQGAKMVLNSSDSYQDISRFHKVADRFFNYIWSCHINLYKGKSDTCPNWQIPMLISLQTTAMPSLFGMKLNNHQIEMLELGPVPKTEKTIATTESPDCRVEKAKSYLLMRMIKDASVAKPGDIVVQMEDGAGAVPELRVHGGNEEYKEEFMKTVFNHNGAINMKALKRWTKKEVLRIRENKRKAAEVGDFINKLKPKSKKKKGHTF